MDPSQQNLDLNQAALAALQGIQGDMESVPSSSSMQAASMLPQHQAFAVASGPPAETKTGKVKSWFEDKGFGFVIPDGGGDDVFVHRLALGGRPALTPGQAVQFDMQWNPQKGKYSTQRCMPLDATLASQFGAGCLPMGAFSQQPTPGQILSGTVKMWYDDKGFGFVVPVGGGDDIFVHRSVLGEGMSLVVGSNVQYEAAWNPAKNKLAASRVFGAIPQGSSSSSGPMGKGGTEPSDSIFLAGLPKHSDENFVRQIFGPYGSVMDVRVLPDSGKPDRAALMRLGSVEQAKWFVDNLHGNMPHGLTSPLTVRFADRNGGKGFGKGPDSRFSPYGATGGFSGGGWDAPPAPQGWDAAPPGYQMAPAGGPPSTTADFSAPAPSSDFNSLLQDIQQQAQPFA